jgi:hypothetical protein
MESQKSERDRQQRRAETTNPCGEDNRAKQRGYDSLSIQ